MPLRQLQCTPCPPCVSSVGTVVVPFVGIPWCTCAMPCDDAICVMQQHAFMHWASMRCAQRASERARQSGRPRAEAMHKFRNKLQTTSTTSSRTHGGEHSCMHVSHATPPPPCMAAPSPSPEVPHRTTPLDQTVMSSSSDVGHGAMSHISLAWMRHCLHTSCSWSGSYCSTRICVHGRATGTSAWGLCKHTAGDRGLSRIHAAPVAIAVAAPPTHAPNRTSFSSRSAVVPTSHFEFTASLVCATSTRARYLSPYVTDIPRGWLRCAAVAAARRRRGPRLPPMHAGPKDRGGSCPLPLHCHRRTATTDRC